MWVVQLPVTSSSSLPGAWGTGRARTQAAARPDSYMHFTARYKASLMAKVGWGWDSHTLCHRWTPRGSGVRVAQPCGFWEHFFFLVHRSPGVSLGLLPKLMATHTPTVAPHGPRPLHTAFVVTLALRPDHSDRTGGALLGRRVPAALPPSRLLECSVPESPLGLAALAWPPRTPGTSRFSHSRPAVCTHSSHPAIPRWPPACRL